MKQSNLWFILFMILGEILLINGNLKIKLSNDQSSSMKFKALCLKDDGTWQSKQKLDITHGLIKKVEFNGNHCQKIEFRLWRWSPWYGSWERLYPIHTETFDEDADEETTYEVYPNHKYFIVPKNGGTYVNNNLCFEWDGAILQQYNNFNQCD